MKELKDKIGNLKSKKASGYDGICNEFLKIAPEKY